MPLEADGEDVQPARLIAHGADAAVEHKQRLDDLRGAFRGLSESHHRLIVVRELEGRSYTQIGETLGMTKRVVESTLFRARRKLGEEYDELVSGRRCERVQGVIAAEIAALLPLPWLRLRRGQGAAGSAASGHHGPRAVVTAQALQNAVAYVDPSGPAVGLGRGGDVRSGDASGEPRTSHRRHGSGQVGQCIVRVGPPRQAPHRALRRDVVGHKVRIRVLWRPLLDAGANANDACCDEVDLEFGLDAEREHRHERRRVGGPEPARRGGPPGRQAARRRWLRHQQLLRVRDPAPEDRAGSAPEAAGHLAKAAVKSGRDAQSRSCRTSPLPKVPGVPDPNKILSGLTGH